jgi:hypothetical protein
MTQRSGRSRASLVSLGLASLAVAGATLPGSTLAAAGPPAPAKSAAPSAAPAAPPPASAATADAAPAAPVRLRSADIGVYVFGRKNQSASQQAKDDAECYGAAYQQSGYEQRKASAEQAPPPDRQAGGTARGAVRGAVAGTVIGAIAGDTGKGAAIGAVTGAMSGNARQREQNRQARREARASVEQGRDAAMDELRRAYGACMDARGYSVK